MRRKQVNILLAILGTLVLACVVLVAGAAWFAMSVLHRQDADQGTAVAAFDAARARFKGSAPVFEFRSGGPVLTRAIPGSTASGQLHTMHVLNWDPDEQSLTQADLPFALLRLKDGPIDLADGPNRGYRRQGGLSIRVSEIERFGPALLIDQELEDGQRVMVWTD